MTDQAAIATPPTIDPHPTDKDACNPIVERNSAPETVKKPEYRINAQNAKALSAKAHVAKAAKKRQREALLKEAEAILKKPLQPDSLPDGTEQALPAPKLDDYLARRLKRIRAQLDKLDRMIAEETDPQKIDRLASAQAKLATQERETADRPLPGSRRPAPERVQARGSSLIQSLPAPPRTPQGS